MSSISCPLKIFHQGRLKETTTEDNSSYEKEKVKKEGFTGRRVHREEGRIECIGGVHMGAILLGEGA